MASWGNILTKAKEAKAVASGNPAVPEVKLESLPLDSLLWVTDGSQYAALIEQCESELKKVLIRNGIQFKPIKVILSYALRSTAGLAKYGPREVHLNVRLLSTNPGELLPTFIHELCHIWTHDKYGPFAEAHGHQWRAMMWQSGYPAERLHHMDTSALTRPAHQRVKAKCGCAGGCDIGPRIAQKVKRGYGGYFCRVCRQHLSL